MARRAPNIGSLCTSAGGIGSRCADRSAAMPPRRCRAGNSRRRLRKRLRGILDRSSDQIRTAVVCPAGISLCVGFGIDPLADALAFAAKPTRARCEFRRIGTLLDGPCYRGRGRIWSTPIRLAYCRGKVGVSICPASMRANCCAESRARLWRAGVSVSSGRRAILFCRLSFAEMLPRPENRVTLDPDRRDAWGIPILRIDCAYGEAELARVRDQTQALRELAELAEVELIKLDEEPRPPGSAFHECGTARMGTDPANSVLDANNQCWDARGLYVTDAACFPSQGYSKSHTDNSCAYRPRLPSRAKWHGPRNLSRL